MVPSSPNRRGANPKRTWRQPQANVAPNPNPCQLFPIAAHCRFEPFQGLGRSRKRHSAFAPLPPLSISEKTHTTADPRSKPGQSKSKPRATKYKLQWCFMFFSSPFARSPCAPRESAPSFSDYCDYEGAFRFSQWVKRKNCVVWLIRLGLPAAASAEPARSVNPGR
jgi:hypothetical protein